MLVTWTLQFPFIYVQKIMSQAKDVVYVYDEDFTIYDLSRFVSTLTFQ